MTGSPRDVAPVLYLPDRDPRVTQLHDRDLMVRLGLVPESEVLVEVAEVRGKGRFERLGYRDQGRLLGSLGQLAIPGALPPRALPQLDPLHWYIGPEDDAPKGMPGGPPDWDGDEAAVVAFADQGSQVVLQVLRRVVREVGGSVWLEKIWRDSSSEHRASVSAHGLGVKDDLATVRLGWEWLDRLSGLSLTVATERAHEQARSVARLTREGYSVPEIAVKMASELGLDGDSAVRTVGRRRELARKMGLLPPVSPDRTRSRRP